MVVLIFFGEALAIYSEMAGARRFGFENFSFWQAFFRMFAIMCVAGAFLVAGYVLGYKSFQNIWIVSAASITSILLAEPFLAWMFFHQLPSKGAAAGLALGLAGFLLAFFWK